MSPFQDFPIQYHTTTHKALLCVYVTKKIFSNRHAYVNNKPQIGTELKSFFFYSLKILNLPPEFY